MFNLENIDFSCIIIFHKLYNGSQFRIINYTWQISSNIILGDGKCKSQNILNLVCLP